MTRQRAGLADLPGLPAGGRSSAEILPPQPDGRLPPRRTGVAGPRARGRQHHRSAGAPASPAVTYTVAAPPTDIDGQARPTAGRHGAALRRRLGPDDRREPPDPQPATSLARPSRPRSITVTEHASHDQACPADPSSPAAPAAGRRDSARQSGCSAAGRQRRRRGPRPRAGHPPEEDAAPRRHRRLGVDAGDAPADPPFFPDSLAPSPFNTYVFGFRDVTGHDVDPGRRPARQGADQRADAVLRRGGRHLPSR